MEVKNEQGGSYEFSAEARFSCLLYLQRQRVPTSTMETSVLNPKP